MTACLNDASLQVSNVASLQHASPDRVIAMLQSCVAQIRVQT